jgi:hypothetical protein
MTKALVKTQLRLQQLTAKGEAGQGTLEYVGMIIVAAIVVVLVIGVIKGADLNGALKSQIDKLKEAF